MISVQLLREKVRTLQIIRCLTQVFTMLIYALILLIWSDTISGLSGHTMMVMSSQTNATLYVAIALMCWCFVDLIAFHFALNDLYSESPTAF
jgi:hypothetical protein